MIKTSKETLIRITYGGRAYSGSWREEDGVVIVSSAYGSRRERIGRFAPETKAALVLEDLVHEWLSASDPLSASRHT